MVLFKVGQKVAPNLVQKLLKRRSVGMGSGQSCSKSCPKVTQKEGLAEMALSKVGQKEGLPELGSSKVTQKEGLAEMALFKFGQK